MSDLSPKERLLKVLRKEAVDRPPVICPGGMMNAAIVDVMNKTGCTLPRAHSDAGYMADLAGAVSKHTGFENIGIPFCMTVEAEVLGSEITLGTLECEPKISKESYLSVNDVTFNDIEAMLQAGRIQTILKAAEALAKRHPTLPVIGNLTGPISTAASIVEPIAFLKDLRKNRENAHIVLNYVSDLLIAFAKAQIKHGATVISIADPTATGEILGPKIFEEYAVKYLSKIIDAIHETNTPVILHICGKLSAVRHLVSDIRSNAISTDALVNLKQLKDDYPSLTTMGNVSTYLLEYGPAEKVAERVKILINEGIDIISPACGLSTSTKLSHIQALTNAVREGI